MSMDERDLYRPPCPQCGYGVNKNDSERCVVSGGEYWHRECLNRYVAENTRRDENSPDVEAPTTPLFGTHPRGYSHSSREINMCMVSVINDYGRQNIPALQWTPQTFGDYKEILRRLEALDAKLSQPDCHDPAKAAWMREVEERLAKVEQGV